MISRGGICAPPSVVYRGGAGITCVRSSATILRCTISENVADCHAGGLNCSYFSGTLSDCVICGNSAEFPAGIFLWHSSPTIADCVISGNSAVYGGGMICEGEDCSPLITGTTISGNWASADGGGIISSFAASPVLQNVILWGNCAEGVGDEAYLSSSITFACCCVDSSGIEGDGDVTWLGGNIFTDPMFCGPEDCGSAPTTDGDYTLHCKSPCAPEHSPAGCGLIGALPVGCGVSKAEQTSWGSVKALYH